MHSAHARVILLRRFQYIAQRIEFFEKAEATNLLGRAHDIRDPHREPKGIDVRHMHHVLDFARAQHLGIVRVRIAVFDKSANARLFR
jgi:hypothetical protein